MTKKKIYVALALSVLWLASAAIAFAAPAADPKSEIIYRASLGRADDVALLIKKGASPDEVNDSGVPLIALAAAREDGEGINVIKALLDAGAHIDAADLSGQTALFYAIKHGNAKAVDLLLSKGANYYAQDTSGYTARDFAYMSGHKDIGVQIDNFIKEQTEKRAEQYKQYKEAVEKRLREQQKAQAQAPVVKPAPAPVPTPTPNLPEIHTPVPSPARAPVAAPKPLPLTPEELAARQAALKKRQAEIKQMEIDLAFNTCAFQYWTFVSDTGQDTELSPEALDDAVDSYQGKASGLENRLVHDYRLSVPSVERVSNLAKRRIFAALNGMPSKSYRFEHGIGKESDMQSRCKEVARRWNRDLPPPPPKGRGQKKSVFPRH